MLYSSVSTYSMWQCIMLYSSVSTYSMWQCIMLYSSVSTYSMWQCIMLYSSVSTYSMWQCIMLYSSVSTYSICYSCSTDMNCLVCIMSQREFPHTMQRGVMELSARVRIYFSDQRNCEISISIKALFCRKRYLGSSRAIHSSLNT